MQATLTRLRAFITRQNTPFAPIDYATSRHEKYLPPPWSFLGALLSNNTVRAIYVVPLAGYVILYSDYFERLFKFSILAHWGFLTFTKRINLIYYGSLTLLVAFGLFWIFSPPLLRKRRDRTQFVADLTLSRDSGTVYRASSATYEYLREYLEGRPSLPEEDQSTLAALHKSAERGHGLGRNAGEYEDTIPRILTFYFNWQNYRRPVVRTLIFCLTFIGYFMLLLPSVDLFLRVFGTTIGHLTGTVALHGAH